jgi:hypothetical protein
VLGVIVMVSVVVRHEFTVKAKLAVPATSPLFFLIVPVTATVYTPPTVGLDHDMTRVDDSNDINVVL